MTNTSVFGSNGIGNLGRPILWQKFPGQNGSPLGASGAEVLGQAATSPVILAFVAAWAAGMYFSKHRARYAALSVGGSLMAVVALGSTGVVGFSDTGKSTTGQDLAVAGAMGAGAIAMPYYFSRRK